MTNEEKLIAGLKEHCTKYEESWDLRKELSNCDSFNILNTIIDVSFEKNLPFMDTLTDFLQETNFSLCALSAVTICNKVLYKENIAVNDCMLATAATIKPLKDKKINGKKHQKELFTKQTQICSKIQDNDLQLSTAKFLAKRLISFYHGFDGQQHAWNFFKRINQDPHEIAHLLPTIFNNKPAIEMVKKELCIVEINTQKLAHELKINSTNAFNATNKIVEQYGIHYSQDIEFIKAQTKSQTLTLIMKDEPSCAKITFFINHFIEKFSIEKLWSGYTKQCECMNASWNSVDLLFNLEKTLVLKPVRASIKI